MKKYNILLLSLTLLAATVTHTSGKNFTLVCVPVEFANLTQQQISFTLCLTSTAKNKNPRSQAYNDTVEKFKKMFGEESVVTDTFASIETKFPITLQPNEKTFSSFTASEVAPESTLSGALKVLGNNINLFTGKLNSGTCLAVAFNKDTSIGIARKQLGQK